VPTNFFKGTLLVFFFTVLLLKKALYLLYLVITAIIYLDTTIFSFVCLLQFNLIFSLSFSRETVPKLPISCYIRRYLLNPKRSWEKYIIWYADLRLKVKITSRLNLYLPTYSPHKLFVPKSFYIVWCQPNLEPFHRKRQVTGWIPTRGELNPKQIRFVRADGQHYPVLLVSVPIFFLTVPNCLDFFKEVWQYPTLTARVLSFRNWRKTG
jgi:hypothetical protein